MRTVVMDVLAFNCGCCTLSEPCLVCHGGVSELSSFLFELAPNAGFVALIIFLVLHRSHSVMMFFWSDFTVLDWLNSGMVVVLVNLSVDGLLNLFMACGFDLLLDNCWSYP